MNKFFAIVGIFVMLYVFTQRLHDMSDTKPRIETTDFTTLMPNTTNKTLFLNESTQKMLLNDITKSFSDIGKLGNTLNIKLLTLPYNAQSLTASITEASTVRNNNEKSSTERTMTVTNNGGNLQLNKNAQGAEYSFDGKLTQQKKIDSTTDISMKIRNKGKTEDEMKIDKCLKNTKDLCYTNENNSLEVYNRVEENKYEISDIQDLCQRTECVFDNIKKCEFQLHNYILHKGQKCYEPHCANTNSNLTNDENNYIQIFTFKDFSKRMFKVFQEFPSHREPLYVSTLQDNIFGMDISKCTVSNTLNFSEDTKNFLHLLENLDNNIITLNNAEFSVLYKNMLFVQQTYQCAWLIVSKDADGGNIFEKILKDYNKHSESAITYHLGNRDSTLFQSLSKLDAVKNSKTIALRMLFYPYSINIIRGVLQSNKIPFKEYINNSLTRTSVLDYKKHNAMTWFCLKSTFTFLILMKR
ncbi:hypothetical protein COBT_002651 [Conglomerata obtusa]